MNANSPHLKKKVLIIDDHRMVTQGLSILLKNETNLEVCGTASSYQEGIKAIEEMQPDIALIDLQLGDGNGLGLIQQLSQSHPNIHSIILSSKDENIMAVRCISAGAKGYVMKDKPFEFIIKAIQTVLNGNLFLSENIKQQIVQQNELGIPTNSTNIDLLSNREFEIFLLVGEGYKQKQIAEKLNISTVTVNTHCQNIQSKLHLDSMRELVTRSYEWFSKES